MKVNVNNEITTATFNIGWESTEDVNSNAKCIAQQTAFCLERRLIHLSKPNKKYKVIVTISELSSDSEEEAQLQVRLL